MCNEEVVRHVVEKGPEAIDWLIKAGVPFTREDNSNTDNNIEGAAGLHLTREGGHSNRSRSACRRCQWQSHRNHIDY